MEGYPVISLCLVGAGPRALVYAKSLAVLRGGPDAGNVEIRVTCVCDVDALARETFVRALDSGSCTVAEYDDFEDVLVLEEFGDFLCTAVFVLHEDIDRRMASASRALGAGKHVFLEPWAPAVTTAKRWEGVDDQFRHLWDLAGRAHSARGVVCELADPVGAMASRFDSWLEANGSVGRASMVNAIVLRPPRPDVSTSRTGTASSELTAWMKPLRRWLDMNSQTREVRKGPGQLQCSLVGQSGASVVCWPSSHDGTAGAAALHCRYCLSWATSTATLVVRLRSDGAGAAEGTLLTDGGEAFGSLSRRFQCGEVDALADVVRLFAQRVARAQEEGSIESVSLAADADDRATYAALLAALDC